MLFPLCGDMEWRKSTGQEHLVNPVLFSYRTSSVVCPLVNPFTLSIFLFLSNEDKLDGYDSIIYTKNSSSNF